MGKETKSPQKWKRWAVLAPDGSLSCVCNDVREAEELLWQGRVGLKIKGERLVRVLVSLI